MPEQQQQALLKATPSSSNLLAKSGGRAQKNVIGQLPKNNGGTGDLEGNTSGSSQSTEYKVVGGTSTGGLTTFADFERIKASCPIGSTTNTTLLTSISLSNVILDAEFFSEALEGCHELKSLTLENVSLLGNFTRVYLPKLTKFVYVQNADDKRDSYKSPETLQQTIFFDKANSSSSPSWNVEQDLPNLGVDISILKGGTRLIDIRRGDGEIFLNIKYCEPIILSVKGSYQILTVINCNITETIIPSIPPTLKYLNVRNSVQRTPHLAKLLQRLTQLEELYVWLTFHCDWPGYELFLNLNDLPQTIKTIGINNVDTNFLQTGGAALSAIETLTVGDYTTNTTVSQGFPIFFPTLQRMNIVNMSDPTPAAGYNAINTAIRMKVKEIAVVNLQRNYSADMESQEDFLNVESILDHAGIKKDPLSCFLLQLNADGIGYTARELTVDERHQTRYNGLGFNTFDSWEDYLKWDSL